MPQPALPSPETCDQARRSRDPRFDGLFFTGVHSTRIYCRPICPAPYAKRVRYFANAAAAEAAGYRPCLRCRPELSPSDGAWRRGDAAIARALALIDEGVLDEARLPELAARVGLGERQLRRLFLERLGASPSGVHNTRRLLLARQLLNETALPMTDVAMAAGFGSLSRFNAAFQTTYRMAPRDLRRQPGAGPARRDALTLRLGYRPPHDFAALLDVMRNRALPGVERVDGDSYARVIRGADGGAGWLRVSAWPGEHALKLELQTRLASQLPGIVHRLRRMFDLDADPQAISAALSSDPRLAPLVQARPGLRLPSGWDGFEVAARAVLGQQVSMAAARTLATRLARQYGEALEVPFGEGLELSFPTVAAVAAADLQTIGITRARAQTLRGMAAALLDGRIDFSCDRGLEDFVVRWTALPGIGPWTAHYIALRGLGHPDALPSGDLVLRRVLSDGGAARSDRSVAAQAERWRPWRAYAVVHLWREAALRSAAGPPSD